MELFPLKAKKSKCLGFLVNESWKFDVSDYPGSSFGYFPPLQLPRSRQSKQRIFLHFPLLGAYIHKKAEGTLPRRVRLHQCKYSTMLLNKIIEPSKSGPGWQKATAPFEVLGELSKASKR